MVEIVLWVMFVIGAPGSNDYMIEHGSQARCEYFRNKLSADVKKYAVCKRFIKLEME